MAGMFGDDAGGVNTAASNKAFKQNLNKVYTWYIGGFVIFVAALAILEQMGLSRAWIGYIFLLATIGLVSILTVCLSLYGTAGNGPNLQPADATIDNPPADLFTKAGWAEFASGFWLGGCGGAAFAWFLAGTEIVSPLVKIAGGVWSVG